MRYLLLKSKLIINTKHKKGENIMPYQLIHFRKSEEILKKKKMLTDVTQALEYLDNVLQGAFPYGALLKEGLAETGWRENGNLIILPERKYQYKGFKKGIAIEGSLATYEYILSGLFRLQIGHVKKKVDAGILLVNSLRSDKTPYGSTREMLEAEMEMLEDTISVPVAVALFDLV
jgi:hypothetical protein